MTHPNTEQFAILWLTWDDRDKTRRYVNNWHVRDSAYVTTQREGARPYRLEEAEKIARHLRAEGCYPVVEIELVARGPTPA